MQTTSSRLSFLSQVKYKNCTYKQNKLILNVNEVGRVLYVTKYDTQYVGIF